MIAHLLRQEKQGGYWLIRDEGRAIELNAQDYAFFAKLYASALQPISQTVFNSLFKQCRNVNLLTEISKHKLRDLATWKHIRHVKSDVPLNRLSELASVAPKRIYFEITRYCNLACRSCFNNSRHKLPNELTVEEILNINQQAYDLGVFEIRYTGGECTRVPGFDRIVKDARDKGFYISIGTNGVYTEEQLEWLPYAGIDWFIISLDGDKTSNDKIRGKGTYDKVIVTLKRLASFPHIRKRLNMVVAKHNLANIIDVATLACEYGVNSLNLIPLRPYGRSTIRMTKDMFNQNDFYGFIHEVNHLRKLFPQVTFSTTIDLMDPDAVTSHDLIVQKKKTCAAGVEGCVIGPQGHVYGCSYSPASFPDTADPDSKKVFIAGNIRESSLKDIWRDDKKWQVFRNLDLYKNDKCHDCNHYTVRCSGSCQIMSYYQMQHKEAVKKGDALGEYLDPYCFVDLLDKGGRGKTADLSAPCGGAGMDGF